jgi:AcrR family transcriptional regulator
MMSKVTEAHVAARTDDILSAAILLFADRGVEKTSMQEIASDAGISTGAVYRYFSSKEELLRACFARAVERNQELTELAVARTSTALDALGEMGRVALTAEEPCEAAALQVEFSLAAARDPVWWGPEQRQLTLAILEQVEGLVRKAQEGGEMDPSFDTKRLALALYALVPGLRATSLELGEDPGVVDTLEVVLDVLRKTAP